MSMKCPRCRTGYFQPCAKWPGAIVCNICEYRPQARRETAEERSLAITALKDAQADLEAVNFDPLASKRGDEHAMPATLGRVRSRINRALSLLDGGT